MGGSMRSRAAGALLVLGLLGPAAPLGAVTEAEQTFLSIYFAPDELHVVSATRSLKSINRIAENVEVISAADIALLQAHSLAEVLETVTGLAVEQRGTPGSSFIPSIQGSAYPQVAAFLDGIPLNNLGSAFPELTFLPVEEVARIEVIKGPASSAWGSALGGVVNIITTRALEQPGHGGAVSASAGEAQTNDLRASVAGRAGGLGYGLWVGRLRSDGLTDGFDVERNTVTAKLDYRSDPGWNVGLALYWTGAERGEGLYPEYDEADRNEAEHLRAQLTAEAFLAGGGQLSVNLWVADNHDEFIYDHISDGTEFFRATNDDRIGGASLRYRRVIAGHEVVFGGDSLRGRNEASEMPETARDRRWALFANDTFDVGPVTFTAGLRRDELKRAGEFWSPSLGAVYAAGAHLLLRADVSRGFTAPAGTAAVSNVPWGYVGNPDLDVEKITSYQAGIEGDAPGFFWYKLTLFRHDATDAIIAADVDAAGNWTFMNSDRVRRKGLEFDARSAAFHGLALVVGAMFMDSDNLTAAERNEAFADATYRIGLKYTGTRGLKALLHVHRTHWDAPSEPGAAADPIVDLHVSQEFALAGLTLELFGSGRNLFDGDQHLRTRFPNPGQWWEAGLRCRF